MKGSSESGVPHGSRSRISGSDSKKTARSGSSPEYSINSRRLRNR